MLVLVNCSKDGKATLTIVNQSNEIIALIQVTVNENTQTVKGLEQDEEVEMQFFVKRDTGYNLGVEFLSGKEVTKKLGYVSYGFDVTDKITITKGGIKFERFSVEMH